MDRASLIFCIGAVFAALVLSVVGFQFAAMPKDAVAAANTPVLAEEMGVVELGDGFGELPASDLMDYYLENPPVSDAGTSDAAPERRFGGC
ncbi:hypothetical protein GGD81_001795 [Rhodobium orientis]|uniref:Uncharacterized protein n=1 Tax=Rhodobium orientis TaxID=34017 RepID=A0A327JW41_9HYPH|nr:hypothetical protein [Rhodobium orientis]MBB4302759.1 hypothetical protein [Rhodobium orientis]MBK5948539.1 hypothetical protein [Rhodobium orientis]RAI29806.1 hypothetical protein CH339_01965 [Rhodobium orientis]